MVRFERDARRAVVVFARPPALEAKLRGMGQLTRLFVHLQAQTLRAGLGCPRTELIVVGQVGPVALPSRTRHLRQRGRTLGERLAAAVHDVRALGYDHVVVVGTDTPGLATADLLAAFDALDAGGTLVLGPARDGGCYLIGFAGPPPADLAALPWRSSHLLVACAQLPARTVLLSRRLDDLDGPGRIRRVCRWAGHLPRDQANALRGLACPRPLPAADPVLSPPRQRRALLRAVRRRGPPSLPSASPSSRFAVR